ncbi:MAG TPA: hypothetical protein VNH44_02570 [Micropepsaceae bacterium]|nr:hypothetical protein [Micropepsaceae bacterium]
MGRKTQSTHTAEKLNGAVAEAARLLSLDLARCSAAMRAALDEAEKPDVWNRGEVRRAGRQLAHASARLDACIRETRQTIHVQRDAPCTGIAPESAPNHATRNGAKAAFFPEKSLPNLPRTGEGG